MNSLANSDNIFAKLAAWLLGTPWEVPAMLAVIVVIGWLYLAYRLMSTHQAQQQAELIQMPASLATKRAKVVPTFRKTPHSDHDLNISELVDQTAIGDLPKKIEALDFLGIFYQEYVSLSMDLRHSTLTSMYTVHAVVEKVRECIQKMQAFKVKLQSNIEKHAFSADVAECFTVWGFDETVHAFNALVAVADGAKALTPESFNKVVTTYVENAALAAANFFKWREETGCNLSDFRDSLNRRLLELG